MLVSCLGNWSWVARWLWLTSSCINDRQDIQSQASYLFMHDFLGN